MITTATTTTPLFLINWSHCFHIAITCLSPLHQRRCLEQREHRQSGQTVGRFECWPDYHCNEYFDQTSDQTEHQTAVVHGGKRRMKNSKSSPTRSSVKGASIRSDDGDVPETMVEVRIRWRCVRDLYRINLINLKPETFEIFFTWKAVPGSSFQFSSLEPLSQLRLHKPGQSLVEVVTKSWLWLWPWLSITSI